MARTGEFYEEDEPLEKIETAFEKGRKVYSAPPFTDLFSDDPDLSERVKDIARKKEE